MIDDNKSKDKPEVTDERKRQKQHKKQRQQLHDQYWIEDLESDLESYDDIDPRLLNKLKQRN